MAVAFSRATYFVTTLLFEPSIQSSLHTTDLQNTETTPDVDTDLSKSKGQPSALQKSLVDTEKYLRTLPQYQAVQQVQFDPIAEIAKQFTETYFKPVSYSDLLTETAQNATISKAEDGRGVTLRCVSRSADLAVVFCSRVAQSYRLQTASPAAKNFISAKEWLDLQIADTEQRSRALQQQSSPKSAAEIRAGETRLRQLQLDLVQARIARILLQANLLLHGATRSSLAVAAKSSGELRESLHHESLLELTHRSQIAKIAKQTHLNAQAYSRLQESSLATQTHAALVVAAKDFEDNAGGIGHGSVQSHPAKVHLTIVPSQSIPLVAGAILGLVSGFGFVSLRKRESDVIETPEDIEYHSIAPLLGIVPEEGYPLASIDNADLDIAGFQRKLKGTSQASTSEYHLAGETSFAAAIAHHYLETAQPPRSTPRIHIVTSPCRGAGKTRVTIDLASNLASMEFRTVVVDCNLRHPDAYATLCDGQSPLIDSRFDAEEIEGVQLDSLCSSTAIENLFVAPAGGYLRNLSTVRPSQMQPLIDRFSLEFDVILLDAPGLLDTPETAILASHTQGVIMVLQTGKTLQDDAAESFHLLTEKSIPVVGTILNRVRSVDPS